MNDTVWISYDLGVRGDYEGLYIWLDQNGAKECGNSLAYMTYNHDGDLLEDIEKDMKNSFEIDKRDRIYIIYRDPGSNKMKGAFLFGNRKAAPWSGYSGEMEEIDEEVI